MLYNGKFFETNKEIDISFSDIVRLNRLTKVDVPDVSEPYNPALFNEKGEFVFVSDIDEVSGWGNVSKNLIKYSWNNFRIGLIGKLNNVTEMSVLAAQRKEITPDMGVVIHEQPKEEWKTCPFERRIAIVPFETTVIPATWISRINACKALLVPCQQNVDAFKASGVTVPIEIIHWGVDPSKFYQLERTEGRPFTFGTMGALSTRKGTDVLVKAFQIAFPNEQDVRLICKTSFFQYPFGTHDKRVRVDMTPVDHEDLLNSFFKQVDCFVFPTRGEGFGLTPLEAMATGIPAIVTDWSGPVEYMTDEVGWKLKYTMAPAKEFTNIVYKEECGDWAEPSIDHLVELMRYAYEHRDEVKAKGKAAAEHVKNNWLWEHKIPMFHEAIKKYL